MSAEEFFSLVDEFLTPSMEALGYHRIGGSENGHPLSHGILTSSPSSSAKRGAAEHPPFRLYDFGFEAGSAEVRRLVHPDDPESADELWLSYEPATGKVDMTAWVGIAHGRVDWDAWTDTGPCTVVEVRRRLAALGQAVAAFVRGKH